MLEDRHLLKRIKHAENDALREIYVKYKDMLYTIAISLTSEANAAEDVLHDVFVALARNAKRLSSLTNLKGYLITCVINRCRDMLKSKMYNVAEVQRCADSNLTDQTPDEHAIAKEQTDIITGALSKIPLPQREVIVMHLQAGLKFKEIANLQQISINTVQGRYRYGLEKLRTILDGDLTT